MAVITKQQLNESVMRLAAKDRTAAVAILARFKAMNTTELLPDQYQAALDQVTEALSKLDASTP